ncbi:hypothetical protein [Streptosporangium subroseum]|uniref:hypothetical protein n=1 Tax=Streptosporangium subroseum TaxID=106412 RepID=UPI0030867D9A|nr:hypothetical protein OHB15_45580 [Streptosporangium subroseum]
MTPGQTTTEPRIRGREDDEVTDATAEKHDLALAAVQRLLSVRGVRSRVVHTIGLKLFGDGRPYSMGLGQCRRFAPELVVRSGAGMVVAEVNVGARSGSFLVSMRDGRDIETVPPRDSEKVANLILSAQFGGLT